MAPEPKAPSFGGRELYADDDAACLLFDRAVNLLDAEWDRVAERVHATFDQSDGPHPIEDAFFNLGGAEDFEDAFLELWALIPIVAREPLVAPGVVAMVRELFDQICTLERIVVVGPGEEPLLVVAGGTPRMILYDDDESAPDDDDERGYEAIVYRRKDIARRRGQA